MQAHQLPAMSTEWKKFDPTSVEELWDEMKGSRVQYEITPDRQGFVLELSKNDCIFRFHNQSSATLSC